MFIKLLQLFCGKKSLQSTIKIPTVFNSSFGTAITLCRLVYMFMGEMVKFVIYAGALLAACILSAEERPSGGARRDRIRRNNPLARIPQKTHLAVLQSYPHVKNSACQKTRKMLRISTLQLSDYGEKRTSGGQQGTCHIQGEKHPKSGTPRGMVFFRYRHSRSPDRHEQRTPILERLKAKTC